jgi:hypothetical protein
LAARVFFGGSPASAVLLRAGFFFVAVIAADFAAFASVAAAVEFAAFEEAGADAFSVDFTDVFAVFAFAAGFSAVLFAAVFLGDAVFADTVSASAFFAVLVRVVFFAAGFASVVRFFGAAFFEVSVAASCFFAAAAVDLDVTDFFFATASTGSETSLTGVPAPLCRFKR